MSSSVEFNDLAVAAGTALPSDVPSDDATAYEPRVGALRRKLVGEGLTHALVYADREHSANVQYLTGFDPRFEEALLVVGVSGRPVLLVGNEGIAFGGASPIEPEVVNVRELSLPGQPWHDAVPLDGALRQLGLAGGRVGVVGWKPFDEGLGGDRFDVPAYVVEALRDAVGPGGSLRNATALLSVAPGGLRTRCSATEIAQFEFSARLSSRCIQRGLDAVAPGVRELDLAAALALPGLPLTMHPIVASGDRVRLGVVSATERRLQEGDPVTLAVGFRGALNARAGLVLPADDAGSAHGRRYLEALAGPYLDAVAAWHERLALGVTGGELHDAVLSAIAGRFELALNPGHLIHLEEWLDGSIRAGSRVPFQSGMVLQCDMIPVAPEPGLTINVEDTVALADAELRDELASGYPELWQRVQQRRATLAWALAVRLAPEILPLSDLAGRIAPFLCSPRALLVRHDGDVDLLGAP